MGKRPLYISFLLMILIAACTSAPPPDAQLRLLSDVTLPPQDGVVQTNAESPTPLGYTPEGFTNLDDVIVDVEFLVVTPTLPPSKTPTPTATFTPPPTETESPTPTVTGTRRAPQLPTSEIIPITEDVARPINEVCDSTWFFIEPRPESCPLNPPLASQAVYQRFQNGHMIWVGSQDAIYIMYDDDVTPKWRVYRDYFEEGMTEEAPNIDDPPASTLWQPRRGFGLLWRTDERIQDRIGWALQQWEEPYSVQVQTSDDGAVFLSDPDDWVFILFPGGRNWERYETFDFGDSDEENDENEDAEDNNESFEES